MAALESLGALVDLSLPLLENSRVWDIGFDVVFQLLDLLCHAEITYVVLASVKCEPCEVCITLDHLYFFQVGNLKWLFDLVGNNDPLNHSGLIRLRYLPPTHTILPRVLKASVQKPAHIRNLLDPQIKCAFAKRLRQVIRRVR